MISEQYIYLALILAVIANLGYIRDTLKGNTKPNRVTWFLWGVVPLIAYLASKQGGGGPQALYSLVLAIMAFVVFGASFINKRAYWKLTRFDLACGLVSLAAATLLFSADAAVAVLALSLLADFFAGLPTLIKAFRHPSTETGWTFALEIVTSIIILMTISDWRFVNYAFALYILLMNAAFTILLVIRPRWTGNHNRLA